MSSRLFASTLGGHAPAAMRAFLPVHPIRRAHTRPAQGREQYTEDPGVVAGRGNKDQVESDTTSDVETSGTENPFQDVGQQQAEAQRTGNAAAAGGNAGGSEKREMEDLERPEGAEKKGPHLPT